MFVHLMKRSSASLFSAMGLFLLLNLSYADSVNTPRIPQLRRPAQQNSFGNQVNELHNPSLWDDSEKQAKDQEKKGLNKTRLNSADTTEAETQKEESPERQNVTMTGL